MAGQKAVASYLAIAIVLGVAAFAMASSFPILPYSNAATQTGTHMSFSGTLPQNCLYEIPANDSVTLVPATSNTSIPDWVVEFSNGTTVAFPENACPQPVYPKLYSLASVIVQSPSFTAAENGSRFLVEGYNISMINTNSQGLTGVVISLAHWSNQTYLCGTYSPELLGLLQVSIPFNQTTRTYDFSNMTISSVSTDPTSCVYLPTTVATMSATPTQSGTTNNTIRSASATNDPPSSTQALWYLPGILIIIAGIVSAVLVIRKTKL
jgi:hypothetical protein